jgi:membrane protein YqaA with SNARE-associated domain
VSLAAPASIIPHLPHDAATAVVPAAVTTVADAAPAAPPVLDVPGVGPLDTLMEGAVETATGPVGLVVIFVYSFLIAFALPGVSEVVLAAPLDLGLSTPGRLAVIILVSGVGKAAGSVFAFHLGQEAKHAGPVERWLRNSRFDVMEWTERRTVQLVQEYGFVGLALALSVPFFPDTLSIYAFAVLADDYTRFALATFAGSVGRLLVTLALVGGTFALM